MDFQFKLYQDFRRFCVFNLSHPKFLTRHEDRDPM